MNIFQIKTKPHGNERTREFIDGNFICIGWPGIGNLEHTNTAEIKKRLGNIYNISGHTLGNNLGQVNAFVNTMKKGDVVFITDKDWAHIGIVGDYEYQEQYDNDVDGMCHRRSVEWVNRMLISDLDSSLQRLVNLRNTICQYPGTLESSRVEEYLSKKTSVSKENSSKLDDLYREALGILEGELKSSDPDRRLKAATELLRLKSNQ